jgi:hypothetical protein
MLALNFPNSAPAPTPGYDEGMEGGMPDNESLEYGPGPQPGLSPTAALGPSAASPEAMLQTLLNMTGGDPQRLLSTLMQIIALLQGPPQGQPGAPVAPPSMF